MILTTGVGWENAPSGGPRPWNWLGGNPLRSRQSLLFRANKGVSKDADFWRQARNQWSQQSAIRPEELMLQIEIRIGCSDANGQRDKDVGGKLSSRV